MYLRIAYKVFHALFSFLCINENKPSNLVTFVMVLDKFVFYCKLSTVKLTKRSGTEDPEFRIYKQKNKNSK